MKNKRHYGVKYILAKNARSNGNSIIHCWMSMLLTGICGATTGAAVICVNDYGVGCETIGRLESL